MKQPSTPQYAIPQHYLTIAIESLKELSLRLEIEAANLSKIDTPEARMAARACMERAWDARKAHEFFLKL